MSTAAPTPETDDDTFHTEYKGVIYQAVHSSFARTLERQRDEARRDVVTLQQWKQEQLTVAAWWQEVSDVVCKHPDAANGEFIYKNALRFIRERDKFKKALEIHEGKKAPVQGYPQGIPWDMHMDAYGAYCQKWGEQKALIDLEGRNCRGGFGLQELDMLLPGWRDEIKRRQESSREALTLYKKGLPQ